MAVGGKPEQACVWLRYGKGPACLNGRWRAGPIKGGDGTQLGSKSPEEFPEEKAELEGA